MKKYLILIDKSWLAQNVFRSVLSSSFEVDMGFHLEDINVLASEQKPALLVISENAHDEKEWLSLEKRRPLVKKIKKIFISKKAKAPGGFLLLKPPFKPEELLRLCDCGGDKKSKKKVAARSIKKNIGSKRAFARNILTTKVFFNDEIGNPLIYMNARDISLGGMFIEGGIPLKAGSLAFISFGIKGKPVTVTGQAVRVDDGGIGVRFMGLPDEARKLIGSYCANVS
ncbi:MAG: hypothetical protein COV46_07300 [Deltaproteobacteria bacterium CG11_big_fil_rev_8_21_14_0_20_49_13]|nr:MAG: hypothetical protein COV46_07300 [Deltaproteobacteria bacterium CG11_big_fil_rev_8_21_14_0_20_49_13]